MFFKKGDGDNTDCSNFEKKDFDVANIHGSHNNKKNSQNVEKQKSY